jgi:hypothetical protein
MLSCARKAVATSTCVTTDTLPSPTRARLFISQSRMCKGSRATGPPISTSQVSAGPRMGRQVSCSTGITYGVDIHPRPHPCCSA